MSYSYASEKSIFSGLFRQKLPTNDNNPSSSNNNTQPITSKKAKHKKEGAKNRSTPVDTSNNKTQVSQKKDKDAYGAFALSFLPRKATKTKPTNSEASRSNQQIVHKDNKKQHPDAIVAVPPHDAKQAPGIPKQRLTPIAENQDPFDRQQSTPQTRHKNNDVHFSKSDPLNPSDHVNQQHIPVQRTHSDDSRLSKKPTTLLKTSFPIQQNLDLRHTLAQHAKIQDHHVETYTVSKQNHYDIPCCDDELLLPVKRTLFSPPKLTPRSAIFGLSPSAIQILNSQGTPITEVVGTNTDPRTDITIPTVNRKTEEKTPPTSRYGTSRIDNRFDQPQPLPSLVGRTTSSPIKKATSSDSDPRNPNQTTPTRTNDKLISPSRTNDYHQYEEIRKFWSGGSQNSASPLNKSPRSPVESIYSNDSTKPLLSECNHPPQKRTVFDHTHTVPIWSSPRKGTNSNDSDNESYLSSSSLQKERELVSNLFSRGGTSTPSQSSQTPTRKNNNPTINDNQQRLPYNHLNHLQSPQKITDPLSNSIQAAVKDRKSLGDNTQVFQLHLLSFFKDMQNLPPEWKVERVELKLEYNGPSEESVSISFPASFLQSPAFMKDVRELDSKITRNPVLTLMDKYPKLKDLLEPLFEFQDTVRPRWEAYTLSSLLSSNKYGELPGRRHTWSNPNYPIASNTNYNN